MWKRIRKSLIDWHDCTCQCYVNLSTTEIMGKNNGKDSKRGRVKQVLSFQWKGIRQLGFQEKCP